MNKSISKSSQPGYCQTDASITKSSQTGYCQADTSIIKLSQDNILPKGLVIGR